MDIQRQNSACPSGYQTIWDWEWPGTVAGCDCITGTNKATVEARNLTQRIYTGTCTSNQTAVNCGNIAAKNPVKLNKWANGDIFCIKRTNGVDFVSQSKKMNA